MKIYCTLRMVRRVAAAILLLCAANSWAFQATERKALPDLDKRQARGDAQKAWPAERAGALRVLQARVPGAKVDFEPVTGSPRMVSVSGGFLTGRDGKGAAISATNLAGFGQADPHRVTKAFLKEHRALFGHGPEALDQARVARDYTTPHNGMRTVVWEQQVDDLPVFRAVLLSHTTSKGELISISDQFVSDADVKVARGNPKRAAFLAAPSISARQALATAAQGVGEELASEKAAVAGNVAAGAEQRQKLIAPGLSGESEAKLIWVPTDQDALRLCWDIVLTSRQRGEMFRVLVDAATGEVLVRQCLTKYISAASYRVFTSDSPSPFSPGHSTPLTNQPPIVPRTLVTLPALNTNASPNGWIDDGVNETRGNNADAHTDRNADNSPDLPRPQGSPFRVFDFPMDLAAQDPTNYAAASVVQLFYVCNWMHDRLYELGFTEAAGNFQVNNFGRGGFGNDAVQADAMDGSGTDNANMSTPPDGSAPRMQMYVFTQMTPRRDGDLDTEIVLHEYTHGLSWRLVGGGQALGTSQSDGMGEGWSDWYGLTLLSEPGDNVNGCYAAGAYASHRLGGSTDLQNYYFGIRRYPYTTDLTKNPLTFKDIDPAQADNCSSGAPYHTTLFGPCSTGGADEVHGQGEVWCVTLWDARASLIAKYGWAVGNQLILQLVTDGMKLTPPEPNFLQARDGILLADQINNGGANLPELWAAFARRGLGFSATSPASTTTAGVRESFDVPDVLRITPANGFTSRGEVGGPFDITSQLLVLTNTGVGAFNWTLVNTSAWLNVGPIGGTLAPGTSALVTAGLNGSASTLPLGIYNSTVWFSNLLSGVRQSRTYTLRVGQIDFFTELFAGDNDLDFQSFTFTPNGGANFYSACREVATNFPTDPTGGTSIFLSDDSFTQVAMTGTNTVAIYNRRSSVFFIGSNGYLTMDSGDSSLGESFESHFTLPRVSALFDDLNPSDGGSISWKQTVDRVAVTFASVREYGSTATVSFQMEMFYDGRIRLTYLAVGITDGLAGLSAGQGVPPGFEESNLSSYQECAPPDSLRITPSTGLIAQGYQGGPFTPSNITYTLRNVGTNLLNWSASHTQTWVTVSTAGGSLIPGASTSIVVSLNAQASTLIPGAYTDRVAFSNLTSGFPQARGVALLVRPIPGEIAVLDSLPPAADLQMPFGDVIVGLSRTEHLTITNSDSVHPLIVNGITLRGGVVTMLSAQPVLGVLPPVNAVTAPAGFYQPQGRSSAARAATQFVVPAGYAVSSSALRMLLLASGSDPTLLRSALAAFPDVVSVDYFNASTAVPTLSFLAGYNVVVIMSEAGFANATQTGDLLADYVDGGGRVIEAVAALATGGGWELAGRFVTGGYEPFLHGPAEFIPHTLGSNVIGHPIMAGVNSLTDGLPAALTLKPGVEWVANWNNGTPLVAVQASRVVGVNIYAFDSGDYTGDVARLFHNAAVFLAGTGFALTNVPALPVSVPALGSMTFDVVFAPDAVGSNAAVVVIESNDADEPIVEVQLTGRGILDYLFVTPAANLVSLGHPGGPFSPVSATYVLSNGGPAAINWTASHTQSWVSALPSGGALAVGQSVNVTVGFTVAANSLTEGTHHDLITFSNVTTTHFEKRNVRLTVFTSPIIAVAPASMSVTNAEGRSTNVTLVVSNKLTADASLTFNLIAQETGRSIQSIATAGVGLPPAGRDFTEVAPNKEYQAGRLLVRFAAGVQAAQRVPMMNALGGAQIVREYKVVPGLCLVKLPAGQSVAQALQTFNRTAGILYAEPDYAVKAIATPNDPRFGELWGMNNTGQTGGTPDADIDAPAAWDLNTGSRQVVVAVIDTGVDYTHPDLTNNIWTNPGEIPGNGIDDDGNGFVDDVHGYDFVNGDGDPMDDHYHGTHVSGTIGAEGNNGIGVAGVCWKVRIMALKFLDAGGGGNTADAISAIEYATLMGARVMNNSWGGGGYEQSLKDAIDAAGAANIVFVAAVGNDFGNDNDVIPFYPSGYDSTNILSVMATDQDDLMSDFSNFGLTTVDLAGPGTDVLSCEPGGGYQLLSGTSMATPHVSGACALLLSANPLLNVASLKQALISTVDSNLPGLCVSGGRLNLARALAGVGATWITVTPAGGTNVTPGAFINVSVGFHAGDLPAGSYTGQLVIACNDLATPSVTIPVSMRILADSLQVTPSGLFSSVGAEGGPFAPSSMAYTVSNTGLSSLNWAINHTQSWVSVSPGSGTLAAGASLSVTSSINAAASLLATGVYTDNLVFSNSVSGAIRPRPVTLSVVTPLLSIADAYVLEGDAGTTNLIFTVSLMPPTLRTVTVAYATASGTAQAGTDYAATNGVLTFLPGQTNATVLVAVFGDTNAEPTETFFVNLSGAANAVLGDAQGLGQIINDETSGRVAVFGAPSEAPWNEDVRQKIEAAGSFTQVDAFLVNGGDPVPALAQLQEYAAVLVYSDAAFNDSVALGNVLADYVDGGGGVVLATFAFGGSLQIRGRLATGGYLPFTIGDQIQGVELTLTADQPAHPILAGVASFSGGSSSFHNLVGLNTGASLLAHWSDGLPLVAEKSPAAGRVVGLNFYPPSGGVRIDFWNTNTQGGLLMANALIWAGQSGPNTNPPVLVQQPASRTVTVGGTATFSVTASGAAPLSYYWRRNGSPIAGANASSYATNNVQLADSGSQFSCLVSNAYGTALSSQATLTVTTGLTSSVLLIWDINSGGTLALSNALATAGIAVTMSATAETGYNGVNPSPTAFSAVIHLNGTTYETDMPMAGQIALSNYVAGGGGYIQNEWDAYEFSVGRMARMRDLILFDRIELGIDGGVTLTNVPAQAGHPVLGGVPASFSIQTAFNFGPAHVFSINPVTILMRHHEYDAVAVREFGLGRIVGFKHAGNYELSSGFNTLSDANVQQLYINAVQWAGRPSLVPTDLIHFDDLPETTAGLPVPAGYHGLSWSNFYELNGIAYPVPSGYSNGVVSVSNVAFNASGAPASILSPNPFTLISTYLTAAWTPNLQTRVKGYVGGALAYDRTFTLQTNAPTLVVLNYEGVTEVNFSTSDSSQLVMDNVSVRAAARPILQIVRGPGGQVDLNFISQPGVTYILEYKNSLSAAGWNPLQTFAGDGTLKSFTETPTPAVPQRFYRLRLP